MTEVIRHEDRYYILATSSLADDRTRVLKHGETFAVFDRFGDARTLRIGEQGIYHEGCRFVSCSVLRIGGQRPLLLGSTVSEDNVTLSVDLTNPDLPADPERRAPALPVGTVHILRTKFLWDAACHERIEVHNHGEGPAAVSLQLDLEADFADVFEVRGTTRPARGRILPPSVEDGSLTLRYDGLDDARRTTRALVTGRGRATTSGVSFEVTIEANQTASVDVVLTFGVQSAGDPERTPPATVASFGTAATERLAHRDALRGNRTRVATSNELFNNWLDRSYADLRMLTTATEHGDYPYAGIPWFSTPFGRDGIITAYEALWTNPSLARGVLLYLAATQATEEDAVRDAQPGKIVHERRLGEMAALGEVPFANYYGTVDATPLFVFLAGAYLDVTGDVALIEGIAPNIDAALQWCETHGDADGDGFLEYAASTTGGLVQQGWKDSHDSVFHADGSDAAGPIALCEVQAYLYGAYRAAARIAEALWDHPMVQRRIDQAESLRARFEAAFWSDEIGTYALALDGDKRRCSVRTSNAGHCLLTGIASEERARAAAHALMDDAGFSGWGIRTLAAGQARYRPISYHNGSVWPHDNALIAQGFARYGLKGEALRVLSGLFDASARLELHRLPELMCGFTRRPGQAPTRYPLACEPQAWASASVFMLLQACLGLSIDASSRQVLLSYPTLPPFLETVSLTGLRVGEASVDLRFQRFDDDVGVDVVRRDPGIEIVTVK